MDIILPTRFNNPNLPVIERPGFSDSFDRPALNTLGVTDDGKPWDYFGFTPWSITSDGHAVGTGAAQQAAVDAATADGTLTTVIGKAATEGTDQRSGLLFRMVDRDNYLWACPNTAGTLTIYGRVGGSTVISQSISGHTLSTGDTLAVHLRGPEVAILHNGATVATRTIAEHVDATLHGFYGASTGDTEFDSIEFTPA